MKLQNIGKSYGKQEVFKDFTLEIEEGEILCVLGESGGGKTTLLNILAGLIPFEGTAESVPSEVSYIFQEPRLVPNLTVRQNLSYVGGEGNRIEALLSGTELLNVANKRPSALSGGEKQRVAIARAFCVPFSLLLMDEPFSSLDTALKIRLSGVFAELWKERERDGKKRTAVFVTHDLEEALTLADRVIVLWGGKIIKDVKIDKPAFPAPYGRDCKERGEILSALLK